MRTLQGLVHALGVTVLSAGLAVAATILVIFYAPPSSVNQPLTILHVPVLPPARGPLSATLELAIMVCTLLYTVFYSCILLLGDGTSAPDPYRRGFNVARVLFYVGCVALFTAVPLICVDWTLHILADEPTFRQFMSESAALPRCIILGVLTWAACRFLVSGVMCRKLG